MMRRDAGSDLQLLVMRLEKRVRALEEAVAGSLGKGARAGSPFSVSCAPLRPPRAMRDAGDARRGCPRTSPRGHVADSGFCALHT